MTFSTILLVPEMLCSFRLVLEGKAGKEMRQSSRLDFLEKFSANNFALSDVEDNNPGLLNTGGLADLALLRTLWQFAKSSVSQIDKLFHFISLLACTSLAAARTLWQRLLACLHSWNLQLIEGVWGVGLGVQLQLHLLYVCGKSKVSFVMF